MINEIAIKHKAAVYTSQIKKAGIEQNDKWIYVKEEEGIITIELSHTTCDYYTADKFIQCLKKAIKEFSKGK